MKSEIIFESVIDGKFKFGYIPFTVIAVMLCLMVVYFFMRVEYPFLQVYFWYFIIFFIALEILLIKLLSPTEKISFLKKEGSIQVSRVDKEIENKLLVLEGFSYWWNYDFGDNSYYNEGWNGGGNSSLSGRGSQNRLNLYLVLYGKNGEIQELAETLEVWESFPVGWGYDLEDKQQGLRVFYLKKLVKFLLKEEVPIIKKRKWIPNSDSTINNQ